jgi:hypothetical protein
MGESGSRMCLAFEAELVSPGTSKLQGDRSIKFSIMREPDFAHTAGTNFFAELIAVGDQLSTPQWRQCQLPFLWNDLSVPTRQETGRTRRGVPRSRTRRKRM